jgi:hypothetical protein
MQYASGPAPLQGSPARDDRREENPDLVRCLVLVEPSGYGILRPTPQGQKYIADESNWRDGKLARFLLGRTR